MLRDLLFLLGLITLSLGYQPLPKPPANKSKLFVTYPGIGSYRLFTDPLTWKSAYIECQLRGAHLAVLETKQEARVMKLLIDKTYGHTVGKIVIAGFHALYSENHWVTIFGHPLHSVYESWARNQPDNLGKVEMCGGINSDGLMEDIPCTTYEYPFMCEKYEKVELPKKPLLTF